MNILISVIVPVYNVEKYLERCIQSILDQTYSNMEIILINDGSKDSSGTICDKFALEDHRVKVYHIPNGGSSIARNYGLKKSTGEFIGFVDSDDWIKPNMFTELLEFAIKNKLKVVETSSCFAHTSDKLEVEIGKPRIENQNDALKRIITNKRFAVWRRIYHKSILKERYFIEGILHQDVYYTLDIVNKISHIGFFETPFYVYNVQNPTSVIRSDYSIKKLNSIDAGAYVVENTTHHTEEIQTLAKQYATEFLMYHYNSLFYFTDLDKNKEHRKKIRNSIKCYYNDKKFHFYSYAIKNLPLRLYKPFLVINNFRIKIQSNLIQLFRDV